MPTAKKEDAVPANEVAPAAAPAVAVAPEALVAPVADPAPAAPVAVATPASPLAGTMIDANAIMSVQGEMVVGPGKSVTVTAAFGGATLVVKTN